MQVWSNESQERYVLAIAPENLAEFEAMCARERCPYAVVGDATQERVLRVTDPRRDLTVIDLPMDVLFGKPPRMHRDAKRIKPRIDCCPISPASAWTRRCCACCVCRPWAARAS
jgi:phosphoribosylformylglycinamidine synthase